MTDLDKLAEECARECCPNILGHRGGFLDVCEWCNDHTPIIRRALEKAQEAATEQVKHRLDQWASASVSTVAVRARNEERRALLEELYKNWPGKQGSWRVVKRLIESRME